MPRFNSLDDLRRFMLSQPFDKELPSYKSSLYPKEKLVYEKNIGPYFNYVLDWQTGKYEYLSDGFKELTGYSQGYLDRGIEATFEIMHPSDREAVHKMVAKILEVVLGKTQEEFNRYSVNYNFRIKKTNGGVINFLQQPIYVTLDRKGNIIYDAGIVTDISRYRTDGNLSLIIMNPEGKKIVDYYPKEDFAPHIATARELISELDQMAAQSGNTFLREVQKVLAQQVDNEEFGVKTFSRQLNVSRSQLYRSIKRDVDLAPSRLIRLYRLQQSLEYLSQNKLQISEVAYRVGFQSPTYFSRCFNEEFECSPSDYQEQVQ